MNPVLEGCRHEETIETLFLKRGGVFDLTSKETKIMNDEAKTSAQSIDVLSALRSRVAQLERNLSEALTEKEVLRDRETHFRRMVEDISDVIFEVDHQGVVLYFSPIGKEVWGYDQEDVIGNNFIELVHPDDRDILIKRFVELSKGVEKPLIYRIKNKAGEFRWVRTKTKPRIENGAFIGASGALIDINDQKRVEKALRESEEKFFKAFQTAPYAITITRSADGKFIDVNDAFISITGFNRGEALTDSSIGLKLWGNEDDRQRVVADLQAGHAVVGREVLFRAKNGSVITGLFSAQIIQLSLGPCILSSINDISERKRAEAKLQEALDSLRKAFGTIIQVMVTAVETRDPYTAGHQDRSAALARAIATEMGLSQDKIDGISMAGSIHDIGKMSVPAEILSKPTNLTEIEFPLIKEHVKKGFDMLKDVESPWPLAEIVYQHHERMDGSGYPRHLKGEEILIEARILAVADVVESMASHRPYRPALGIDAALAEIENNKGTLYDADVVDVCLRLFREKGYQLLISM